MNEHYHPRHTPGPWRNESGIIEAWKGETPDDPTYFARRIATVDGTCMGYYHEVVTDEAVANSRLVSAAPELFAALDECERFINARHATPDTPGGREALMIVNRARAALSKANHG